MRVGRAGRDGMLVLAALGLMTLLALKVNMTTEAVVSDRFIIVDGDSLTRDGARFRLLGIDAPESRQQCRRDGLAWACGEAARQALARLLPSGRGTCRGRQRDRYGRLLVTCSAAGVDVNAEMVRQGMAVSFGGYWVEEAAARDAKVGLWAGSFERPQDFRRDGGLAGADDDTLAATGRALFRLLGWPWL